jgi:hypothetical protein
MPNPNAIVSTTIRLEPSLDRAPEEMLRAEGGIAVQLEGERRVRLDPADERSAGFARVLDGLSKQRLPVYLEVDPATDAITRLLIPHIARVAGLSSVEGALAVELEPSHARHLVPLGGPDSAEIEAQLRKWVGSRTPVLVTEDNEHNIIDVRDFIPAPDGPPLPPFPPPRPRPPVPLFWPIEWLLRLFRWLWWWIYWPFWWWFRCISPTRAQQVFDSMASRTCNPLTVPPPCIPFLYPDDGCWARAHEMCRLMINMGLSPMKVWIRGTLHVSTRNNPTCSVYWGWHVAPTLCVRGPRWFQTRRMVIDPSLFTTPVTEATWKSVQGDPSATLTDTNANQFWPSGGTDPTYADTNYYLAKYRLELLNRSIAFGPPPYANCP